MALGTPYLVCNDKHGSGSATLQVAVTHDTAAGDSITVAVAVNSSDTFTSVTDSKGNVYTQAKLQANGVVSQAVYVAQNTAKMTVAAGDWVKLIVGSTSSAKTLAAIGCSGVATASAVDQAVSATGSSASPTVTSAALAQADELCIAQIVTTSSGSNVSPWGNSFTGISAQQAPSSEFSSVAWKIVAVATAVTASGTVTSSQWSDILVTLKAAAPAAAASASPQPQPGSAWWRNLFRRDQQMAFVIPPLPPLPPVFPGAPLPITVELLLNGTWTNISSFVQQRELLVITRGRPDESQSAVPSQLSLMLNNRGGDFSPRNTAGQFSPFIGRNTQIRVSVTASSVTGVAYSGYRFWGEVSAWPPRWDVSGRDVFVPVVAAGILRRYAQGASLGSPLRRFYTLKTDATAPIAYWPCEEQVDATQFANLISPGNSMTFTGTPGLASDSAFGGSDPVPLISLSTWTGLTGSFSTSGDDIFTAPGAHPWVAPTATADVRGWGSGAGGDAADSADGGQRPGGGGAFAQEAAMAFTPGQTYTVIVPAGGRGASFNTNPQDGGDAVVAGDVVTLRAGGGKKGTPSAAGLGGTSANTVNHPGGAGGNANGGGGGGSGGLSAAGNTGGTGSKPNGAAAVSGGGPGGTGSGSGGSGSGSVPASGPGGGGGGAVNPFAGTLGGNGYAGKVEIISVPTTVPTNVVVRHLLDIPAAGTVNGATILRAVIDSGTLSKIELYYGTGGKLGFRGFDTVPVIKFDSAVQAFSADGRQLMVSMELAASGSNVNWKLTAIVPGAGAVVASFTGSFAGTMGAVSQVVVNPNGNVADVGLGHIVVQYALESLIVVSGALNGYAGELASDRFTRLCTEQGIASAVTGNGADTPAMGPQPDAKFTALLQEIEDADRGLLIESRDFFGLRYRTRVSLQNQFPDLFLDYAQAQVNPPLEPTTDDQFIRNDVSVSRTSGASVQIALESGALSVLDPPNGVGSYTFSLAANVQADAQLTAMAQWILAVGTVDEYRYPVISVILARAAVAGLFAIIPAIDCGDYVQIANPPAWLPAGPVKQLAYGFTETLGAYWWQIDFNGVPESVYEGVGLPTW